MNFTVGCVSQRGRDSSKLLSRFFKAFEVMVGIQLIFHQSPFRLSTAFQYNDSIIASFACYSFLAIS